MNLRVTRPPQEEGVEMHSVPRLEGQQPRRDSARSGSNSIKSRGGFSKFLRAQGKKTAEYVKDHDLYGQPVSLNYKGEDTFKTVPGGVISLAIKVVFVLYAILKFKYMMVHQEWEITRQERVLTDADIAQEHRLQEQHQLSVGVQMNRKTKKLKRQEKKFDMTSLVKTGISQSEDFETETLLTNNFASTAVLSEAEKLKFEEESTLNDLANLTQFFRVFGMVEKRQQSQTSVYNLTVNPDLYHWKEYINPKWNQIFDENENTYRMEVDLSDAVLKGLETDDPTIPEVISKFQLRFDIDKMRDYSFTACLEDPNCGSRLNVSTEYMLERVNHRIDDFMGDLGMEKESYEAQDYFTRIASSSNFKDKTVLRDAFFLEYLKGEMVGEMIDRIEYVDEDLFKAEIARRSDQMQKDPLSTYEEIDALFFKQVSVGVIKLSKKKKVWYDDQTKEIENIQLVIRDYIQQEKRFREELNIKLQKYNIELVVHDQIESFKKHDDENFNYPFQNRSSKIASFTVDLDPFAETYEYPSEFLKFRKSFVCLEPNIFKQMLFFTDLAEEGISSFSDLFSDDAEEKEEIDDQLEDFCDSKLFQKIKYQSSKSTWKDYKDDYEPGVIDGKILLEVVLGLDAFKTEITRSSSQILDYLGDIGGFYGALDLMVFVFGGYFSAKLFAASIAKTLYIQSRKKKDIAKDEAASKADEGGASNFILDKIFSEDGDEQDEAQPARRFLSRQDTKKANEDTLQTRMKKIRNQFSPIEFSSVRVVLDPILSSFFCCFSEEKLVKFPIFKRQKVLAKCEDKLNGELEITNLLTRVRESYEMLQNLQTEQSKELLKFSKDKVIDLQDSNSSSSEDEEEELPVETPGDNEAQPATEVKASASESSSACSSEYLQFTLPEQIRKAFDYSIVKSLALDAGERVDLLQKLKVYEDAMPSEEAASQKDNLSQSLGSDNDLPDQLDQIQMRKFGSPRVMSASSKQVKAEGARVFNSGVGYDDAGVPQNEAKAKEIGRNQEEQAEADNPGGPGEVKTALANAEPPDDLVETSQVILEGVAEPGNSGAPSSKASEKSRQEQRPEPEVHLDPKQAPP